MSCDHEWTINVHMRTCGRCMQLQCNTNYGNGRPKWVDMTWDEYHGKRKPKKKAKK